MSGILDFSLGEAQNQTDSHNISTVTTNTNYLDAGALKVANNAVQAAINTNSSSTMIKVVIVVGIIAALAVIMQGGKN